MTDQERFDRFFHSMIQPYMQKSGLPPFIKELIYNACKFTWLRASIDHDDTISSAADARLAISKARWEDAK